MLFSRRFRTGSLKQALVLFLFVSLALTLLSMLFAASVYRGVMRSNTEHSVALYAYEQQKLLEDELQTVKTALYSLSTKAEVLHYLNAGQGYRAANARYINSLLSDLSNYVPCISDVLLVTDRTRVVAMANKQNDMPNFLLRNELVLRYFAQDQKGTVCLTLPAEQKNRFFLAMFAPIGAAKEGKAAAVFCTLEDLLGKLSLYEKPFALYWQGQLIYANSTSVPSPDEVDQPSRESSARSSWVHIDVHMTGWKLVFASPLPMENEQRFAEMWRWSSIVLLFFCVIECGLLLAIYKTIIAPIASISLQSTRINSSALLIDNPAPGRRELNTLVDNINAMVARTNQLTGEINTAKLRLMDMDIAHLKERNMFLQAQINPHFLNNMLECICGMAIQAGNQDIRETTCLLSRLYRYCLKSPESTLGEELECVAVYEKIIHHRYDQRYRIDVEVAEDLYLLPLTRMVMEPLVENAVQHGFTRGAQQNFRVRITAELTENELEIRIWDNGCGIPAEQMAAINAGLRGSSCDRAETGERIGLYNVGARLQLVYGKPSGLYLERNETGGLTVRMRVLYPAVEEDRNDRKNADEPS